MQKKVRSLRKFPRFNIPAIQIYVFFDARPFASTSFPRLRSEFFHLRRMPTQIFSLRMDDVWTLLRKQTNGAFPLSLLRLPTHRPSILSSSCRHRIISDVWFKTELRALLFSKYYTTLCLSFWRFFHFFHSPNHHLWDLFLSISEAKSPLFTHNRVRSRDFFDLLPFLLRPCWWYEHIQQNNNNLDLLVVFFFVFFCPPPMSEIKIFCVFVRFVPPPPLPSFF